MYKLLGADQREYGPATADQVRQWILERRLNGQSLVRLESATSWTPLSFFPEFSATLASVGPTAPVIAPGTQPLASGTNSLAVASLVVGLAGIPLQVCLCCGLPIFSPLALLFGIIALAQLKGRPEQAGRGMAWAGIVLSILGLLSFAGLMALGIFAEQLERWIK